MKMVVQGKFFLLLIFMLSLIFVVGFDKPPIIVIDPGHQEKADNSLEPDGPNSKVMKPKTTSGATGVSTKQPEYKLNLEVSLLLRDELKKRGFQVMMIRETNNVTISNSERAAMANKANADLMIRIHADGSDNSSIQGISILYPSQKVPYADEDKKIAAKVLEQMIKETKAKSRGIVERSDLSGFNWSKVPTILVEMGFLSNVNEDKKMAAASYQQSLAIGMANGIEQHFQSNVKPGSTSTNTGDSPKAVEKPTPTPVETSNSESKKEPSAVPLPTPEQPKLQTEQPKDIQQEAKPAASPKLESKAYAGILALVCLGIAALLVRKRLK
jgi:N-acetylmuramoyl-L-alanine amidase